MFWGWRVAVVLAAVCLALLEAGWPGRGLGNFLTPKQMLTLAENLIDRIPEKIMEGGNALELE